MVDLTGKTAIVTGGARGIGLGIVRRLHEAGASVVATDIDETNFEAVHDEFSHSARVLTLAGDVSDSDHAAKMVELANETFGGLDTIVNNAGVFQTYRFLDIPVDVARRTLEVNVLGVMVCSQAAARQMIKQGRGGRIIVVSSIEAFNPSLTGLAHYGASKHGVAGLLKTMALELAPHGISVNSVNPGGVRTPGLGPLDQEMVAQFETTIPAGRMGVPDDIGRAVLFLASDLSAYMTGAQVAVDGGRTLRGAAF